MIVLVMCVVLAAVSAAPNWPLDNNNNPFDVRNPGSSLSHYLNQVDNLGDNIIRQIGLQQTDHNQRNSRSKTHKIILTFHVSDQKYIHVETRENVVYIDANDGYLQYQNSLQLPNDVGPECHWDYVHDMLTLRFPAKKATQLAPVYGGLSNIIEVSLPIHVSDPKDIQVEVRENIVYIHAIYGIEHYENSVQLPSKVQARYTSEYKDHLLTLRFPVKQTTFKKPDDNQNVNNAISEQKPNNDDQTVHNITHTYEITLPLHASDQKCINVEVKGNVVYVHVVDGTLNYQNSIQLPSNVVPDCHWNYENDVLTLRFAMKQTVSVSTEKSVNNQKVPTTTPHLTNNDQTTHTVLEEDVTIEDIELEPDNDIELMKVDTQ